MPTRDEINRALRKRRQPSPEIEAKIARLGRGRDLKTRCTWPGGALEFDLYVLTQSERSIAEADARQALRAAGLDIAGNSPAVLEAVMVERTVHLLAAAMRDPQTGEPLFASADELAEVATDDEIEKLAELYASHRVATDPSLDALSSEELAEIDECLKKKDPIRLSNIVSHMPPTSLRILVGMLAISLIGKSMSIAPSPPSSGSDSDPNEGSASPNAFAS